MENNQNWPKIELFPRLATAGKLLMRLVSFCPLTAPDFMSNHYHAHPLDGAISPVVDWPLPVAEYEAAGSYYHKAQ